MGVRSSYTKNVQFNLSSLTALSAEEPMFQRTGYTFKNWYDADNNTYSDQESVRFNADEVNLSADWTINQYSVSWTTPSNGQVEVSADGLALESGDKVDYKTVITVTAVPDTGYKISALTVNGQPFASGGEYEVGGADVIVAATFARNLGTLTYYPGYQAELPLYFQAQTDNCDVKMEKSGNPPAVSIEYSISENEGNPTTWNDWDMSEISLPHAGDRVYFRAKTTNGSFGGGYDIYRNFVVNKGNAFSTSRVACGGNIMSLVDKSMKQTSVAAGQFKNLFYNCRTMTSAPTLPAMQLSNDCYYQMFAGCEKLSAAPALPAAALANGCYTGMFQSCKALTEAPALSAGAMTYMCYNSMFRDCTALTAAPELCATALANNCYEQMFYGCTGLRDAPVIKNLPACKACYQNMFTSCTSLSSAEVEFSEWPTAENATYCWMKDAKNDSSCVFKCPSSLSVIRDVNHILSNWTVTNV